MKETIVGKKEDYKHFKLQNKFFTLHTSNKEISDLLIAWILVSLAFTIAQTMGEENILNSIISLKIFQTLIISAITIGLAFLLHELAHKIVAQKYKCWAEFRADFSMLFIGLFISILGFIFLAPGAVMIYGKITNKQNGLISLSGPLINIILALILLPFLLMKLTNPLLSQIVSIGFLINSWLALFNMIPFWNFDGAKIYAWNKPVYFIILITAAFLLFIFFKLTL